MYGVDSSCSAEGRRKVRPWPTTRSLLRVSRITTVGGNPKNKASTAWCATFMGISREPLSMVCPGAGRRSSARCVLRQGTKAHPLPPVHRAARLTDSATPGRYPYICGARAENHVSHPLISLADETNASMTNEHAICIFQ
jgi:hypothetical protein